MNKKFYKNIWFVFFVMVIVWNFPNFIPWEKNIYPTTYWLDFQERLFKCVLLAAIFVSLFSRPWVAWLVSWGVGLFWLPISVAVRYISESPINSNLVGMAVASSPGELKNLILSIPSFLVMTIILWNIFCILILFWLKREFKERWPFLIRLKIFLYSGMLLMVPYVALISSNGFDVKNTVSDARASVDIFEEADRAIGSDAELPRAFPYEMVWSIAQYLKAREAVDVVINQRTDIPSDAVFFASENSPNLVVLVIGESSSRSAWSVFNPSSDVETTPRLANRFRSGESLFLFSNVVAQSISTRQAVPSMLSADPLIWPDGKPNENAKRSIVTLASRAGYKTAWFSNQAAIGQFDGVIAAYADEADTKAFLNPSSFSQQGSYDEILLPSLQRFIDKNHRAFVILHTLGSHFKFEHRYPAGFGPFSKPINDNMSYRNSISYTDYFLDEVIELVSEKKTSAVVIYVSDHGQGLPGERCEKPTVNRLTIDSYEVPALVWLSEKFKSDHSDVLPVLKGNASFPYTNAVVYQTLIDFMSQKYARNGNQSLLHASAFSEGVRMVVSPASKWIDFDRAADKNPCLLK